MAMKDLVEMEETITKCLDYKLNSWTFFDLAMLKVANYFAEFGERETVNPLAQLYSTV